MGFRFWAISLIWTASLWGQRRFNWQDACFKNPSAPYCQGHDYAVKRTPPQKGPKSVGVNPGAATPRNATPSVIVVGGADWRFADPSADALIGINFGALSASPIARTLMAQLGASQGLTETEVQKIVDGLSGVDQVAVSIRENRVVTQVTGRVTEAALRAPEAGLKVTSVSGNAILVGHPDAVDEAVQRIAANTPLSELVHSAEERQGTGELWAIASPRFVGSEVLSAGVKRVLLTLWLRNRFASDMAFEFDGIPRAAAVGAWETTSAAATLEGNVVHLKISMAPDEAREKFGPLVASPLGRRLAALVQSARYLPVPETALPKRTKAVIYGLDGGPKEVN